MPYERRDPENPELGTHPGGRRGGGGGGGGCDGKGGVFTELDQYGQWIGNTAGGQGECVSQEEATKRRNITVNPKGSGGSEGGGRMSGTNGPIPPFNPGYKFGAVPQFNAPKFSWGESFMAPSFEDATKDPGYQFRLKQSLGAIENSAAARGNLRTGGTVQGLTDYASNAASAEYNNVYGRRFGEYGQRYGEAKDKFGFDYTGARDRYAPNLLDWQTRATAEMRGKDLQNQNQWSSYWNSNLTAAQLMALLQGLGR